jgi:hypothetical protein
MSFTTSDAFKAHIDDAMARAEAGDPFAARALSAMALLISGWRYGDPDPSDGPDGDGETVIDLEAYRLKLAA